MHETPLSKGDKNQEDQEKLELKEAQGPQLPCWPHFKELPDPDGLIASGLRAQP